MKKIKSEYLRSIRSIPHFSLIRSAELTLLSYYIDKENGPFLDLGCGDGNFGMSLGLNEIYGIDIDAQAIKKAVKNGYKAALHADASEIPFSATYFSTVFSNCAIEHMDALSDVLKEVNRVLKGHGKFIFTVPTRGFMESLKQDEILKGIGLNRDEHIDAYNIFHHHVNIHDLGEWKSILERAGFVLMNHEYYLPGEIGGFVARMDMLHTIEVAESKELLKKLEERYRSFVGLPFRVKGKKYLRNPHCNEDGTHLLLVAEKS